jgi:hypothetical protein
MSKSFFMMMFIFVMLRSSAASTIKTDSSAGTVHAFCHSEFSGYHNSETRYLINADTTQSQAATSKKAADVCEAALTGALRAGLSPTRLANKSTHRFDPNRSRLLTEGDNLLSGILLEGFAESIQERGYKLSERYGEFQSHLQKGPPSKITLAKFMKTVGPLVQK